MVRKRYISAGLLLSIVANNEKHHDFAMAFQQPPYVIRKRGNFGTASGPSGFCTYTPKLTALEKPQDEPSTTRPRFSKKNHATKRTKPRKLNSDIFWLRKQKNGIQRAEKRLEDAVAVMIQQNSQDEGAKMPSLLRDYQEEKEENKDAQISDERLDQLPDLVSFHAVLGAHAKNARNDRLATNKAEGLLERMKELSGVFPHLSPTTFSYNTVLEAYSNQIEQNHNKAGFERRLFGDQEAMLKVYEELQETGLSPNTYTRNIILGSLSKESEEWNRLENWAHAYLDGSSDGIIPDRKTYNTLFKVYLRAGDAKRAEEMLRKLLKWDISQDKKEEQTSDYTQSTLRPAKYWFDSVLKALVISDLECDEAEELLGRLLGEMKDLEKSGYSDLRPDTFTYNHILNVHAKHGNPELAISLMEEREASSNDSDALDSISYTTVIKSFATAQKKLAPGETDMSLEVAEKATAIWERMREKSISPTIVTYNTLISIWVNVGTRDAMKRAEDIFRRIRYPNSVSYSTLIHGWSKTRLPEAGSRAHKLFKEVIKLNSSRIREGYSTVILCNSVISAYAKSGDDDAPERVDSLLAQLEGRFLNGDVTARPDKITFLGIFDTYAKSEISNADERCDALLDRMNFYRETLDLEDLEPDRVVYNALINALAKSQQPNVVETVEDILAMMESSSDEHLRPDIVTYATVIDCFTKCGEMSLQRADELLRFVEGTFRGGDNTLKPNAVFYSAILQAWAKTGTIEGAEKAEELLQRNIGLYAQGNDFAKPHTIVFNAVMDAIARSNMEGAGPRAEELLDEMESLYQSGDEDMRPSKRSFNAVILAYRNQGNASHKAEELLQKMEEMAASGRNEVRPDVVSYNNAIAAVVEDSESENTADRAQALLDQMEAVGIKPDGRTYSPVIEAWLRRNDEKGNALAEVMITQFLDNLEESKKKNAKAKQESLYEEAVWNVINAYKDDSDNNFYSELASRGWLGGG